MREVSQNWIENQDKTLRDQGLLRLDFLSAHNNNAKAHIIPMGSDSSKSNINEIKDISPYGAPNKNLAMPDLTGKEYLGNGVYEIYNNNDYEAYYNLISGEWHFKIKTGVRMPRINLSSTYEVNNEYTVSFFDVEIIEVPVSLGSRSWQWYFGDTTDERYNMWGTYAFNNAFTFQAETQPTIYQFISSSYDTYEIKFKLQIEKGSTATPYEIPQPNTGYVSTIPSGTNGEVATNLAMPDLTGKEYLGNGVYRFYNANGITIDYNLYSSIWTINGTPTVNALTLGGLFNIPIGIYSFSFYKVSGTSNLDRIFYNVQTNDKVIINGIRNNDIIFNENVLTNDNIIDIIFRDSSFTTYDNYQFKLQIEQGTTASAYQLPNYVPIEIDVEDYRSPLNGLTITWSENFGHAVDYSIEYNGEIYTYLNNTKKTVFVPIIIENTPDANFKIRVHKWSQGGVPIRIERVFVGLHLVYKQDKIFSFNKKKYNNVLGLELPQDQINFELSNLDRMFDPLWYNSYFKYLNEKTEIRAYSGFRYGTNGEEWIKQGTYYLTDWKAPNNSITATFTARDILNLLDADEMYSKDTPLTLDEYCDIILGRDYKGVDDYVPYDLPVNPDGSKKWNIRKNLAVPDLTGKEYLGDGWYRLRNYTGGGTLDYNVNTAEFKADGLINQTHTLFILDITKTYTLSLKHISGSNDSSNIVRLNLAGLVNITLSDNESYSFIGATDVKLWYFGSGEVYNNMVFKLQLEKGSTATPYELPIENANIPVLKETVNKREALQLIAQSIGCHIRVDDDGNISFIRETYGKQIDVPKKILLTKPEFNLGAPVKKIIVPYSKYNPDPNELEVAKIDVAAGDIVEINHDTPYFNGHGTHKTGSVTLQSTDLTWYRSFRAVIGGTGTGQLIVMREPVIKSSVNVIQDISPSGDTLTYENNLIDTQLKASRAIGKIWGELDNSRQVEFELRIDPRIDTFNVVSFPFRVLNLEQIEYMRVDELELTYNGAYKGKLKGVILSNYGGDLTPKTYTRRSDDFKSGEENLKWHLLSE